MFHKYENRIMRYDRSANALVAEARGYEVVPNDDNISSPLVIDKYTRASADIIYGISWSGEDPRALAGLRVPNKGNLWKLDSYVTPFIELADFDSLSVDEAIGKLAQVCNHIALFNVHGDFYFIPKEVSEFEDYILEHVSGKSILVGDVKKDRGYAEIYNYFTVVPSITEISEIEFDFVLVKRVGDEDDSDFTKLVQVNSLNNLKRRIRLVCVRGGKVSTVPLFKWMTELEDMEARIESEVSAVDRKVLMSSTFGGDQLDEGIHTGDFIVFINPNDDTPITIEILGGDGYQNVVATPIATDSNMIYVADLSLYEIGDKVTFVDESLGLTYKSSVLQKGNMLGNNFILLEDRIPIIAADDSLIAPIRSYPEYITLRSTTEVVITSGSEVTILRVSAGDDSNNRKIWSSDGIIFVGSAGKEAPADVFEVSNTQYVSVGCYVSAEPYGYWEVTDVDDNSSKITVSGDDIDHALAAGTVIGVVVGLSSIDFVEIPGSGFEIKVEDPDVLFKAGDVLVIRTDGLVLKEDTRSRKLAVSMTSINKHGKLDFPTIKNRFINPAIAEVIVRDLLDFYKDPHYQLELKKKFVWR